MTLFYKKGLLFGLFLGLFSPFIQAANEHRIRCDSCDSLDALYRPDQFPTDAFSVRLPFKPRAEGETCAFWGEVTANFVVEIVNTSNNEVIGRYRPFDEVELEVLHGGDSVGSFGKLKADGFVEGEYRSTPDVSNNQWIWHSYTLDEENGQRSDPTSMAYSPDWTAENMKAKVTLSLQDNAIAEFETNVSYNPPDEEACKDDDDDDDPPDDDGPKQPECDCGSIPLPEQQYGDMVFWASVPDDYIGTRKSLCLDTLGGSVPAGFLDLDEWSHFNGFVPCIALGSNPCSFHSDLFLGADYNVDGCEVKPEDTEGSGIKARCVGCGYYNCNPPETVSRQRHWKCPCQPCDHYIAPPARSYENDFYFLSESMVKVPDDFFGGIEDICEETRPGDDYELGECFTNEETGTRHCRAGFVVGCSHATRCRKIPGLQAKFLKSGGVTFGGCCYKREENEILARLSYVRCSWHKEKVFSSSLFVSSSDPLNEKMKEFSQEKNVKPYGRPLDIEFISEPPFPLRLLFSSGGRIQSSAEPQSVFKPISLPSLTPEAEEPKLYQFHPPNQWHVVPDQVFENNLLVAPLTTSGIYQVFSEKIDQPLAIGEVYVFPNPTRVGQIPTLHVEGGGVAELMVRIYDPSGDLVHEAKLIPDSFLVKGKPAYEQQLDPNLFRPGVYFGVITATKPGTPSVRKKFKFTILK